MVSSRSNSSVARAGELAQATHRNLNVAGAQLYTVIEVLEIAAIPYLDRAFVFTLSPNAYALGVIAVIPKGRGTLGTDPFIAP